MRRKLDADIKGMGLHARGQELQRIRARVRTLVKKTDNACCWENYDILFDEVLPEGCERVGDMSMLSKKVLLRRCESFIDSRQCPIRSSCKTAPVKPDSFLQRTLPYSE